MVGLHSGTTEMFVFGLMLSYLFISYLEITTDNKVTKFTNDNNLNI